MAQPRGKHCAPGIVDPSALPKHNLWCVSCLGKELPPTWTLREYPDETYTYLGYNKSEKAHFYYLVRPGQKDRFFQLRKVPMCFSVCYRRYCASRDELSSDSSE